MPRPASSRLASHFTASHFTASHSTPLQSEFDVDNATALKAALKKGVKAGKLTQAGQTPELESPYLIPCFIPCFIPI